MEEFENTQNAVNIRAILDRTATGFHGVHDKNPGRTTIRMVLDRIRNSGKSSLVNRTREAAELFQKHLEAASSGDVDLAQAVKARYQDFKKNFDLIYFSGGFSGRKNLDVVDHSGIIPIDIDGLEQRDGSEFGQRMASVKQLLYNDPHVICVFETPSGYGLKVLVLIPEPPQDTPEYIADYHKRAFQAIKEEWESRYDIIIDSQCSNVGRGSYLCHDANALVKDSDVLPFPFAPTESIRAPYTRGFSSEEVENPDCRVRAKKCNVDPTGEFAEESSGKGQAHTRDLVLKIYEECSRRNISITEDYRDWIAVGFALKRTFNDRFGYEMFDKFSSIDASYNQDKVKNKWDELEIDYSGKQVTISSLIWLSKQKGITVFTNLTKSDQFENWFLSHYSVRLNLLDYTVYWDSANTSGTFTRFSWDYNLSSVARDAEKELKIPIDDKIVNRIIKDAASKCAFNPLEEYIDSLIWDGTDRLNDLFKSIETDDDFLFREYFTKWFVNMISTGLGLDCNDKVIVLQGDQGTGKTFFLENLLPKHPDLKLTETTFKFIPEDKDSMHLAITRLLLIFDEMNSYSKSNLQALKSFISSRETTLRSPYGRDYNICKRVSSCCGCVNEERFLRDATGDRRYLVFRCIHRDLELFDSINKEQLLAQVVAMYRSGFDYRFSMEEYQKIIDRTGHGTRCAEGRVTATSAHLFYVFR